MIFLIFLLLATTNGDESCANFTNTSITGEFTSPWYPRNYPHDALCIKLIEAPPGNVIRLHFLENFHIEHEESCRYDYLEIRDGQFGYSSLIGDKICGSVPPSYIESSGRYLWLRFTSDNDISYIGFKIFVEFVDVVVPGVAPPVDLSCGELFQNQISGLIKTEDLSDELIESRLNEFWIDCTWIIEAEPDQKIFVQFLKYELEKPNDCTFNFVEVYGAKTELEGEEGRLKQFCGSDKDSVTSKSNKLHLRFFSGLNTEKKILKSAFEAYFSVFRETKEGQQCLANTEFDCTDGTCIALSLKCNNIPNCKFRNDEDEKCDSKKGHFQLTTDILIIAFLGILLMAGMCSGLMLNIYRKLKQDKEELEGMRGVKDTPKHSTTDSIRKQSTSSSCGKETVILNPVSYVPPRPYPTFLPGPTNNTTQPTKQSRCEEPEEVMEVRDSSSQTNKSSADVLVFINK